MRGPRTMMREGDEVLDWCLSAVVCVGDNGGVGVR